MRKTNQVNGFGVRLKNSRSFARPWLTWAWLSTVSLSVGYGACYIAGLLYHQTYLQDLGIPSEFFRKQPSDYFVYAYTAWLELSVKWLPALMGNFRPWLLLLLFLSTGVAIGFFLGWLSQKQPFLKIQGDLKKNAKFLMVGGLIFAPVSMSAALILVPASVIAVTLVPALWAQTAAHETSKREIEKFKIGCQITPLKQRCYDLVDAEKVIATGFIVEASDVYLALMTEKGPNILPLNGRSVRAHTPEEK